MVVKLEALLLQRRALARGSLTLPVGDVHVTAGPEALRFTRLT